MGLHDIVFVKCSEIDGAPCHAPVSGLRCLQKLRGIPLDEGQALDDLFQLLPDNVLVLNAAENAVCHTGDFPASFVDLLHDGIPEPPQLLMHLLHDMVVFMDSLL